MAATLLLRRESRYAVIYNHALSGHLIHDTLVRWVGMVVDVLPITPNGANYSWIAQENKTDVLFYPVSHHATTTSAAVDVPLSPTHYSRSAARKELATRNDVAKHLDVEKSGRRRGRMRMRGIE